MRQPSHVVQWPCIGAQAASALPRALMTPVYGAPTFPEFDHYTVISIAYLM